MILLSQATKNKFMSLVSVSEVNVEPSGWTVCSSIPLLTVCVGGVGWGGVFPVLTGLLNSCCH